MTHNIYFHFSTLLLVIALLISSCSKSDDQREFENHARTQPQGITEMTINGTAVNGKKDPDDWRPAPMFAGTIDITPSYPNPVPLNSNLRIDLYIWNLETINRVEVYTFEFPGEISSPIYIEENLSTGLVSINLNAMSVANSSAGSQASGIYRIMIYDGRQNLITYGDVRLQ